MKEETRNDDLARCVEFHGHLCPGLSIGIQASRALLQKLDMERADDEELVAIVETDACGSDAVQVLTGCTFGKGNLIWKDFGKHAFTLGDRKTGKAARVCLKAGAWAPGPEHLALIQKIQSGTASGDEKERFHRLHEDAAHRVLALTPEDLFKIEEIMMTLPPKARVVASAVCDRCGEPVRADFCKDIDGDKVCPACRLEP